MYVQMHIECDNHTATVVSAGEPHEILRFHPEFRTYEIDPSNMYCTGSEVGPHDFVLSIMTSDGFVAKFPIPKQDK